MKMKNLKLKNQIPVEHSLLNIEHSPKGQFPVETSLLNVERFSSMGVKPRVRGFTLIELITVMSILVFLIATAVGAYFAWNQTSALRGATDLTLSGLHRARQFAITRQVDTYVEFGWSDGALQKTLTNNFCFILCTNATDDAGTALELVPISPRQDLPRNIVCQFSMNENEDASLPFVFYFKPNGRPYDENGNRFEEERNLIDLILDRGGGNTPVQKILIDPLTGIARPLSRRDAGLPAPGDE